MSRPPTPLSALADTRIVEIVVSGALRDGHWLQRWSVVFVADDLEAEARALWPYALCGEAHGLPQAEAVVTSAMCDVRRLVETWREEVAAMERCLEKRRQDGTLYDQLSQHFSSSIVTQRNCANELAALVDAVARSATNQHEQTTRD